MLLRLYLSSTPCSVIIADLETGFVNKLNDLLCDFEKFVLMGKPDLAEALRNDEDCKVEVILLIKKIVRHALMIDATVMNAYILNITVMNADILNTPILTERENKIKAQLTEVITIGKELQIAILKLQPTVTANIKKVHFSSAPAAAAHAQGDPLSQSNFFRTQ